MALKFDEGMYLNAYQMGEENRRKSQFDVNQALKDVGTITSGLMAPKIEAKKAMKERQKAAPELLIKLRENNVPEDLANQSIADYVRTGNFKIPGEEFGQNEALFYQEEPGKPFKMQEIPRGVKPHVRGLGSGGDVPFLFFDPSKPNVPPKPIGSGPKSSKIITPTSSPADKETPEQRARRDRFDYLGDMRNRLQAAGEEIPDVIEQEYGELAGDFGFQPEEVVTQKKKLFGLIPEKKETIYRRKTGASPVLNAEQQSDLEQAKQAVSKNVVTREEALKRLQDKYPGVNFQL